MKLPKIKLKKITPFLKKLPKVLAERAFLTFLVLFGISLIISALIFFQYSGFNEDVTYLGETEKPLKFKEDIYQDILETWHKREERYGATYLKEYPDPFLGIKKEIPQEPSTTTIPETEEESIGEEIILELPAGETARLLTANTLYEFYIIKEGRLLTIEERAKIWEEKGLGKESEYHGFPNQNIRFLEYLKQELTQ